MKQKILTMILLVGITASVFIGCGQTENASTADNQTAESTEQPEAAEASCEKAGLKTFTCECGDTYTEEIFATGHVYENYVSNEDATYLADGTETAKCNTCDLTDTRTVEGSKIEYTYTEMEATMYAQQTVNVRDLPSTDGNKVGSLSANGEVKVTGQADNGWYRIEYNDSVAYVSDSYLGENKVEVVATSPAQTANNVPNIFDYPENTWVDMGSYYFAYGYYPFGWATNEQWETQIDNMEQTLEARYPGIQAIGGHGFHLNDGTKRWVFLAQTANNAECNTFYNAYVCSGKNCGNHDPQ